MSVPLTINGVTFNYPQEGDTHWGPTLTNWSTAVTNALAPFSGGNISFLTLRSQTVNLATLGQIRLANADTIEWRNFANTGNLPLGVNVANQLTFNGVPIAATTSLTDNNFFIGNAGNIPTPQLLSGDVTSTNTGVMTISAGAITDAKVAAAAAIAFTKLAVLTASQNVVTDASGVITTSASPTLAELAFVGGVTSNIQTQFNTIATQFIVKQIVFSATATPFSTNSASFQATNLTGAITTTSASSRVLVMVSGTLFMQGNFGIRATIFRNGVTNLGATEGFSSSRATSNSSGIITAPCSMQLVDTPNTISLINYAVYVHTDGSSFGGWGITDQTQTMILMEIV